MEVSQVAGRGIDPAHELAHLGARFVVVGGTARWLRGDTRPPGDLDVVVTDGQVPDLVRALQALGVEVGTLAVTDV